MTADITTIGTSIVYQNRWMRVREDDILRSDGSTGLYGVVEKPDYAVIVALEDRRVHLVEQYRYPVKGRYWELPQGSWEDAPHAEPIEVARAELREDTGLAADTVVPVGYLFQAYGYSNQGFHVFLATGLRREGTARDPEELDLVSRAFDVSEVLRMIANGNIKDVTTVAAMSVLQLKGLI